MPSQRHREAPPHQRALFELYRRGEFSAVADALDARLDAGAVLSADLANLRARLYIKNDPSTGLQFLARQRRTLRGSSLAEATMLLGVLHARTQDDRLADLTFHRAHGLIAKLDEPDLADELSYHRACWLWTKQRYDEAETIATSLRTVHNADVKVRAKILESLIASARERHLEQAKHSLDAFRLAMANDDVELQAYATRNLATLARELAIPSLREAAKAAVAQVEWTVDLREEQFKAFKAAAWCHALDGDHLSAYRLLKQASAVAPSDPWRVMAALDRAYLARCAGEPGRAEVELLGANTLARDIDWRGCSHEDHVALVLLAELMADIDATVALTHLARFRELGPLVRHTESFAYGSRLGAFADYSTGIVHARLGNKAAAVAAFEASWKVFSRLHYDWRAGRAALELFRLKQRPIWLDRARAKLAGYPMSWLAGQVGQSQA